jgi:hypothetical protein
VIRVVGHTWVSTSSQNIFSASIVAVILSFSTFSPLPSHMDTLASTYWKDASGRNNVCSCRIALVFVSILLLGVYSSGYFSDVATMLLLLLSRVY